jgi:subtilisin family serine protease
LAAAGNRNPNVEGPTVPVWPAALPGVLAVGSITKEGVPSAFSPQEPWVDLVAVGENVRGTFTTGDVVCELDGGGSRKRRFWGTAIWSGTSFATATVTGRLATLASERGGPPLKTIREVADDLRAGLPDNEVRQP